MANHTRFVLQLIFSRCYCGPAARSKTVNMKETAPPIRIQATINAPLAKVWEYWTTPTHIMKWNHASDDWYTPHAENDLRKGGRFRSTNAARDGSLSFQFYGTDTEVTPLTFIAYILADNRQVSITFRAVGDTTTIEETFDPERENSREQQQEGWQAIHNNFANDTGAG
jgi:uncharacterized protein YndB with AHSA1/START domain